MKASGVVASASPVRAAVLYSPVLKIAYDGIFRLRDIEAKDSLLLTFEKELGGISYCWTEEGLRTMKLGILKILHRNINRLLHFAPSGAHLNS